MLTLTKSATPSLSSLSLSDVDECSEQQPCSHQCVNMAGSYHCVCREGYRLAGDTHSCENLPPPPPPASSTHPSQEAANDHRPPSSDTGTPPPLSLSADMIINHVCVCVCMCFSKASNGSEEEDRQDHSQALGPLLLLVRAMPNSTRTVSNNALRLVHTAKWTACSQQPTRCGGGICYDQMDHTDNQYKQRLIDQLRSATNSLWSCTVWYDLMNHADNHCLNIS